jgi:hypothetical protein
MYSICNLISFKNFTLKVLTPLKNLTNYLNNLFKEKNQEHKL